MSYRKQVSSTITGLMIKALEFTFEFYGDSVYKLKKIVGTFLAQFIKILIFHYRKICYNINVLRQTACLVVNPFTVDNFDNFAFLFNCTPAGRTSDPMMVPT